MLLTANGQNVYPEEIESKLNNLPYIAESVVVLRNFKLVAMVYPDMQALLSDNISDERLIEIMNGNMEILNRSVAQYERISTIEIVENEFEKKHQKKH